jgi:hypothetical protein
MHIACITGDEKPIADERRLCARRRHAGVAEGPLQLQLRQVLGADPAIFSESSVAHAVAPPIPLAAAGRATKGRGCGARLDRRPRVRSFECPASQELRDCTALGVAQRDSLNPHLSIQQRVQNGFGRQAAECVDIGISGRLWGVGRGMTGRAARLKHGGAVLRIRRAGENEHQPENMCEDSDQGSHLSSVEAEKRGV